MDNKKLSFMIVAGELSGDQLGGSIVSILRKEYPNAKIFGVVGPKMLASGCEEIGNIDQLSVMGFVEVFKHLPRILRFKKYLVAEAIKLRPDVFIGIDSPDFNLRVAHSLKAVGIKTIQYVSPSVWAWRQGRIHGIKRSVDHVCCLFPFEVEFYKKHSQDASFVGHPIATEFSLDIDKTKYKKDLGIFLQQDILSKNINIAILPGSRVSEVSRMLPLFLSVISKLYLKKLYCKKGKQFEIKNVNFVIPCAHRNLKVIFDSCLAKHNDENLPITVLQGQAKEVLQAADIALITSGTATLEALMAKCLIVAAYKMPRISYLLAKMLVKTPYIALPNILAGKELVPELIQRQANVDNILIKVIDQIDLISNGEDDDIIKQYLNIHKKLLVNPDVFLQVIAKFL